MKIGIVGAAISQAELQRYEKKWDLWSVNNLYKSFPAVRFSRWFEIHEFSCQGGIFSRRGLSTFGGIGINRYLKELNGLKIPVYMRRKYGRVKQSVVFPFREIMKKYGGYFGCSLAWMVALAIEEGADEIGFFGVALAGNEYYYQRPSVEYLIGLAKGMGIKVFIHGTSGLLKADYAYAYKENYDLIYLLHGAATREVSEIILTAIQQKISDYLCAGVMNDRKN